MSRLLRSCLLVFTFLVAFAPRANAQCRITLDPLASPVACLNGQYTICWTTSGPSNCFTEPNCEFVIELGTSLPVAPFANFDTALSSVRVNCADRCGTLQIPTGLDTNRFYAIRVRSIPSGVVSNVKFINVRKIDSTGRPLPFISIAPVKSRYCEKDTIVLTLDSLKLANTVPPPTYQWILNDSVIQGQTRPILRYTNLKDNDCFRLLVTKGNTCAENDTGSSAKICIDVKPRPFVRLRRIGSGCADSVSQYLVDTSNIGPGGTIKWYRNGVEIVSLLNQRQFNFTPGFAQCRDVFTVRVFTIECPDSVTSAPQRVEECGRVQIDNVLPTSFCAGDTTRVCYSTVACFSPTNVFTFFLSDASGDFTNPTEIGSVADTNGGCATVLIPASAVAGTNYRIRIVSSSPTSTSINTSGPLTIFPRPALVTSGGAVRCGSGPIKVTVNSVGAVSYAWYTAAVGGTRITRPGGALVAEDTFTVFVNRDTTFFVEAVNANGCLTRTRTAVTITVGQPISVNAGPNQEACERGATINILGGSPTGGNFSGVAPAESNVVSNTFNPGTLPAGVYTVKYLFISSIGCRDSATKQIEVLAAPVVDAGTPDSTVCTPGPPISFFLQGESPANVGVWSSNNSVVSPQGEVFINNLTLGGADTLTYTVTTSAGCRSSDFRVIRAITGPQFTVTVVPPPTCGDSGSVTLSPFSASWTVTFNGGAFTPTGAGPLFTGFPAGAYTVTVSDGSACITTRNFVISDLVATPVTILGLEPRYCSNAPLDTITASIPGLVTWLSQPAGAISSTVVGTTNVGIITPSAAVAGPAQIIVTVRDLITNCLSADTAFTEFVTAPVLSVETDTTVCANSGLIPLSAGGVWDGSTAIAGGPVFTFNPALAAPVNIIRKTVSVAGCSSSVQKTIRVNPIPTPIINTSGVQRVCQGNCVALTVSLASGSPIAGHFVSLRRFGSLAVVESNQTGIFSVCDSGKYVVTVRDTTSAACEATSANFLEVIIDSIGTVDAGPDQSICRNAAPITLIGTPPQGGTLTSRWSGSPVIQNIGNGIATLDPSDPRLVGVPSVLAWYVVQEGSCSDSSSKLITFLDADVATLASIGGRDSSCVDSIVLQAGPVGAGISYQFLRNDTAIGAPTSNPLLVASRSGAYQVVITSNNPGACTDSSNIVNIVISSQPVMPTTLIDISACLGDSPIPLENPPAGGNTGYAWLPTVGVNSPALNTYTFNPVAPLTPGNYTLTLIVRNGACRDTATKGATVFSIPVAAVGKLDATTCTSNDGKAWVIGADTAIVSIVWLDPSGGIITIPTGQRQDTVRNLAPGGYQVQLTNRRTGCTSSLQSFTILSPNTFAAQISGLADAASLCRIDSSIVITATPSGGVFKVGPTGGQVNDLILQLTTLAPGPQIITYSVQDAAGCLGVDTVRFTIKKLPESGVIRSTGPVVCQGTVVNFTTNAGSGNVYQWFTPTTLDPSVTTSTYTLGSGTLPGNYSLIVRVDSAGCNSSSVTSNVQIRPGPVATLAVVGDPLGCVGSLVTLVANGGIAGDSVIWRRNGTEFLRKDIFPFPTFEAATNGSYTAEITNGICANTSLPVVVNFTRKPQVTLQPSSVVPCFNTCATLTAQTAASGVRFVWYYQDITNANPPVASDSIGNGTSQQACSTGRYSLRTILVPQGCDTLITTIITTQPRIDTSLIVNDPTRFCQGGSANLVARVGAAANVQWINTVTGPVGSGASISITQSGSYYARITSGACRDSSRTVTIVVDPLPVAALTPPTDSSICQGSRYVLTATSCPSCTYQFTGQSAATNDNTYIVPSGTANQVQNVLVTVFQGPCSNTSSAVQITTKPSPLSTLAATGATNICPGDSVLLQGGDRGGSNASFLIGNTPQTTPTTQNFIQARAAGVYYMVLELNGCTDTSGGVTVTIPTLPVVNAGANRQFCISEAPTQIQGYSPALSPSIRFVEAYIVGDVFDPASAGLGSKSVTIEATVDGCSTRDTATYVVAPGFTATVTPINSRVCANTPVRLNAAAIPSVPGALYTYEWFLNGSPNPIPGAVADSLISTQPGAYTVRMTLGACNSKSAPANVDYLPFTQVNAGRDTSFCANDLPLNLPASPAGGTWSGAPGNTAIESSGRFTPSVASLGANKLAYTTVQGGCTLSDTVIVTIKVVPVVRAKYRSVVTGRDYDYIDILQSAELIAIGATTYTWGPAINLSATTGDVITASPRRTQLYQVVGDLDGCKASDTVIVKVRTDVRVANGFSPNNDGENDFWNIYNIQAYPAAEVRVYNRWGALVYKVKGSQLQNFGDYWNGKSEGEDVPVGVYYYTIDLNNNQKPFIGSVTLVR